MTRKAKSILAYVFIGITLATLVLSTISPNYYLLQVAHASSSEAATAAATGDAASAAATAAGASAASATAAGSAASAVVAATGGSAAAVAAGRQTRNRG